MKYPSETNQKLLEEISTLKQRIKQLEQLESKRKQSEKALLESEERYRSLVDNVDFGINLIDKDFKIIATNVVSGRQFNKPASELLGKYCFKEFEKRQTVCEHCPGVLAMASGQAHQFETEGMRDDGSRFLIRIHAFPLFYPDGTIRGFNEVVEDITERKQMEGSLIESERRLADIIDFLPDATFAIDLSGKVIAWNRAIEEMTGVKAEDILGKGNYEYAIPFYGIRRRILIDLAFEFNEEIEKKYDFVRSQGNVLLAETNVTLRGEPRTLWGKAGPLYDSRGNVAGTIESVRDITELRQARKALQKSHDELEIRVRERTAELMQANKALEAEISERKRAEEKIFILANLSDISPLSITVFDLQDNLLYANQRTFDMHGYSKKEFLARNLKEIDAPSSAAWIEERKKEVLETGEARFIVEHYRKDGTCFPLEVYLKATKWREQTVLLCIASDITERQRVEEELRKYREKLEIMVTERTRELEEKTKNLKEINTTLNVLLQKREEDKKIMEERFVANIGTLVLPYVEKIRKNNLDVQQQFCLDTIEKNLDEIVSPLLKNIQQFNLTPREIQIASLINDGKTTKEIALALGIAEGSIAAHRKNIRKKLGLDRNSNLQSQLRFFEK
ncbi:MAG: PAS domain S-box protein [Syntrophaceae bacterium]|nr:PAS domain S-box protein [Syntrophaceae bacterium]